MSVPAVYEIEDWCQKSACTFAAMTAYPVCRRTSFLRMRHPLPTRRFTNAEAIGTDIYIVLLGRLAAKRDVIGYQSREKASGKRAYARHLYPMANPPTR